LIKFITVKIDDVSAFQTMQMVMIFDIRIEAAGSLVRFSNREKPDLCKGKQSSVNCVEANAWKFTIHNSKDIISSRMIIGFNDSLICCCSLRSYFQVVLPAYLKKKIKLYFFS